MQIWRRRRWDTNSPGSGVHAIWPTCSCASISGVRTEKGDAFSYEDIKKVYTLILYEKGSAEFHRFPDDYIHHVSPVSDTGIKLEWAQESILIPLDIFRLNLQNKGINSELDAWLTFLSVDEPEIIERLIQKYPQFKPMYQQIYYICRNTERVMELYSEELKILDRNTVQLMIDEMQEELIRKDQQLELLSQQNDQQLLEIARLKKMLTGNCE